MRHDGIAQLVSRVKKDRKLKLRQIAATSGMQMSQIHLIAHGKTDYRLGTLLRLLDALDMTLEIRDMTPEERKLREFDTALAGIKQRTPEQIRKEWEHEPR